MSWTIFYPAEGHDVGLGSSDEERIWFHPEGFAQPFDAEQMTMDLVVQDAQLAIQRSRGFFSPSVPSHLAGTKGNAKGEKKGKSLQRQGFGMSASQVSGRRHRRDERRRHMGLGEVPMTIVIGNVVCSRCGERKLLSRPFESRSQRLRRPISQRSL